MRISVEGNIGSGKSSLLTALSRDHGLRVFLEPVQKWGDWLSLFYDDPRRWGLSFNLKVLTSFHDHHPSSSGDREGDLVLFERSPLTCRYVFTTLQHANGHMTDAELELFDDVYDRLRWEPDLILYVRTRPVTCMRRIERRAREAERHVALDYVTRVHARHEELLYHDASRPTAILDGEQPAEQVLADALAVITTRTAGPRTGRC